MILDGTGDLQVKEQAIREGMRTLYTNAIGGSAAGRDDHR